ncbi:MAG: glycosyltransferase [Coriobacteriia bacterium]|nr:glycosyltransferase [Coriobacteriia bacterium]
MTSEDRGPRVVAVIPARDEAPRIAATVAAAGAVTGVARVIVVDDGSTDGTADAAAGAGAEVVRLERNAGKGGAVAAGLAAAGAGEEGGPDAVLLLDGDLGGSAAHAALLLEPVLAGRADMAVAVLPRPPRSGGFGLVVRLARWGIRRLTGWEPRAPLSGQRALDSAALQAAGPPAPGFGLEVATTVRVLRAGLRVREIDVDMSHAATGRDLAGFLHRGRQFADVLRALAMLAAERRG